VTFALYCERVISFAPRLSTLGETAPLTIGIRWVWRRENSVACTDSRATISR